MLCLHFRETHSNSRGRAVGERQDESVRLFRRLWQDFRRTSDKAEAWGCHTGIEELLKK